MLWEVFVRQYVQEKYENMEKNKKIYFKNRHIYDIIFIMVNMPRYAYV